ncbi:PRC-barrel domain-containing protein [Desulfopila sp. IMCC35008]|uniref:PRC-barrel domain-containing protein n=1 Tax=Desulfopila sp. IMCC35008 TaxID=2653858 RepID=UPI0013CF6EFC|nr:PRC-barrel domain-containing protein [Desulfopila sp. IMCC35008]
MTSLKSIKEMQGYELGAQDGNIGRCNDFLFDDSTWTVRYLVGDTHKWLPGRKVLISPISIGSAEQSTQTISVGLTKEQIKNSPDLGVDAPVSRQYEILFNHYHDWGNYWEGPLTWGHYPFPRLLQRTEDLQKEVANDKEENHLRSSHEILSYSIKATDTKIGHVEDFIVDEETWLIRYLVVDTSNWLPGSRKVIISPDWVEHIEWSDGSVEVGVSSKQIKNSPDYDPDITLDRDYETSGGTGG